MRKSWLVMVLVGCLMVGLSSLAFAHGGGRCGDGDKGHCELLGKIKMIMFHKAELGLTEQQVEKLVDIKHAIMKDVITLDAQEDVIAIDIKALMGKDVVDMAAIKPLVEKAAEIDKEKTLKCIEAFASAKKVLTPEQSKKMKEMCFEAWKSMAGGHMGKGTGREHCERGERPEKK